MLAEIWDSDSRTNITFTAEQAMAQHPQFHITPQFGWMNDPNGMFQHGALYHVFFQFNPAADSSAKCLPAANGEGCDQAGAGCRSWECPDFFTVPGLVGRYALKWSDQVQLTLPLLPELGLPC
ncbi:hypothetical protein ABBQ38_014919 [Trebouxia sp. C0009 RCD-2024]